MLSTLNDIDFSTNFKSVKFIFLSLRKFLILVVEFCNFLISTGSLSISSKRYYPPWRSKPKLIFLLKRLLSVFKKFDEANIIKKTDIKKTVIILNFEKYNTFLKCYFFSSGVFIKA